MIGKDAIEGSMASNPMTKKRLLEISITNPLKFAWINLVKIAQITPHPTAKSINLGRERRVAGQDNGQHC